MYAPTVAKLLDFLVGNVSDEGLLSVLPVVEILIQCFPVEVPQLISTTIQKLIVMCLSEGSGYNCSKIPVKAYAAAILARLLVMNINYLAQLTSEPSLLVHLQKGGFPQEEIILCLADVWLDKIDNVESTQRKTYVLSLSMILTLGMPQVLDRLVHILSVCTTVILDGSTDLEKEYLSVDYIQHNKLQIPSKELKKRQINFSDPINQISIENSVRENIEACAALHEELFNAAISKMRPSAFAELKQALHMQ